MKLFSAFENYVALKRTLGAVFSVELESCAPSAVPWATFPSRRSLLRVVGSFAVATAFQPASGKT